jgi:hypothetical protein
LDAGWRAQAQRAERLASALGGLGEEAKRGAFDVELDFLNRLERVEDLAEGGVDARLIEEAAMEGGPEEKGQEAHGHMSPDGVGAWLRVSLPNEDGTSPTSTRSRSIGCGIGPNTRTAFGVEAT